MVAPFLLPSREALTGCPPPPTHRPSLEIPPFSTALAAQALPTGPTNSDGQTPNIKEIQPEGRPEPLTPSFQIPVQSRQTHHIHIYTHICTYMHAYTFICIHKHRVIHILTCLHAYIHVCMHNSWTHTYMLAYAHIQFTSHSVPECFPGDRNSCRMSVSEPLVPQKQALNSMRIS